MQIFSRFLLINRKRGIHVLENLRKKPHTRDAHEIPEKSLVSVQFPSQTQHFAPYLLSMIPQVDWQVKTQSGFRTRGPAIL